ncbi:MAG TPA: methylated-DNA--[protein]-cysteine S-methyltransferase [Bryobacteraceae bacterium]|nr:methylated-DNA--[protein]-cysteine S-methyltransferase [Bryobacteraceae bacterium]
MTARSVWRHSGALAYVGTMQDLKKWQAVLKREPSHSFFYAVKTTGVFCRPSCPSRRPRPENVLFFDSPDEAVQAGFRACARCAPGHLEPRPHLVTDLCRYIDANLERKPSLSDLAQFAGLTPWHVQRTFRAELGVSPREYAEAKLRELMPDSTRRVETIRYTCADSALGVMLIAESDQGICAVSFGEEADLVSWLRQQFPACHLQPASLPAAVTAMLELMRGQRKDLPLDIRATAFQQKVWKALREVPRGETVTYEQLALAVGQPAAVRAAANACAANRIAVAIPCHRIVRKNGGLGGYRWGAERKQKLLQMERTPGERTQKDS